VIDGEGLSISAFLGQTDARVTERATLSGPGPEIGTAIAAALRTRIGDAH
jgi:hypothetical protein